MMKIDKDAKDRDVLSTYLETKVQEITHHRLLLQLKYT